MSDRMICAVDVGTGSARAGVFDSTGRLLGRGEHPIAMNRAAGHAEHDSHDIWAAVCAAVRGAVEASGADVSLIQAIGFDATCSLVAVGSGGRRVTLSTSGEERWDTIVWLDHRAIEEADECTRTGHEVLAHVGGVMSPEMQTPKLMWVKRHLPASWQAARGLFDLADWLTFRATGNPARSQCTLACKWTYLAHAEQPWRQDFFATVGLDDVLERAALPPHATRVGEALGRLTDAAASELGLSTSCQVSTGLIDAYAGALGTLGGFAANASEIERHLALIAGTSSCVMAMSTGPRSFAGGWGPYFGVALPELWMIEGGQSATGALLDHVIRLHSAGGDPSAAMHRRICERIVSLRAEEGAGLANRLHVLPDFHGNRSPLADPHALGVISGLTLDTSFDSLARLYWRTCVAIALGVRHVLDTLNDGGFVIDTLHVTGGHTRNPLLMELYADATGCRVVEPQMEDAVLLGTAMVAAAAADIHPSVTEACMQMQQAGRQRNPDPAVAEHFNRDYRVFLEMHRHRAALDRIR